MNVLVDNTAALAIESCLLEKLNAILSAETVMNLDDNVVQEIAAEGEDSKTEARACFDEAAQSGEGDCKFCES